MVCAAISICWSNCSVSSDPYALKKEENPQRSIHGLNSNLESTSELTSESTSDEKDFPEVAPAVASVETSANRILLQELEKKYGNQALKKNISDCAVQCRKVSNQLVKQQTEKLYNIKIILEELHQVQKIDAKFILSTQLKIILEAMTDPEKKFSDHTRTTAETLYQRFEAQNWGEIIASPTANIGSPTPTTHSSGPASPGPSTVSPVSANGPGTIRVIKFADNHRIFGRSGIMHGILLHENTATNKCSPFLDPNRLEKKQADRLGDNGLTVGHWVPKVICLLRDGGHGAIQAGVYGNKESGAFSIILTGTAYEKLDAGDRRGRKITYSGPGSLDNEDPVKVKDSIGNTYLQTSYQAQSNVRVFRGPSKQNVSPPMGYRYDGLYKVARQETGRNEKGGAIVKFVLQRNSGQLAINRTRPSFEDRKALREYKNTY